MFYPCIFHYGTLAGVTDSCHELWAKAEACFLIDCDLFQRADSSGPVKAGQDVPCIEYLLVILRAPIATRIHIRYVGQICYLLAAAFRGLCSKPVAALFPIVLEGAFKLVVSQKEVEQYVALVQQRITVVAYDHWFTLSDCVELDCGVRLQCAGHMLGFDFVEVELAYPKSRKKNEVLFSSDCGAPQAHLMLASRPLYGSDILGLESTYSDRHHECRRTKRRLQHAVYQTTEESALRSFVRSVSNEPGNCLIGRSLVAYILRPQRKARGGVMSARRHQAKETMRVWVSTLSYRSSGDHQCG